MFTRQEAQLAKDTIESNKDLIQRTYGRTPGASKTFEFETPVAGGILEVCVRLRGLHGDRGPEEKVEACELELGRKWSKGSATDWWASAGGDLGNGQMVTVRLNVPASGSETRAKSVSIQFPGGAGPHNTPCSPMWHSGR